MDRKKFRAPYYRPVTPRTDNEDMLHLLDFHLYVEFAKVATRNGIRPESCLISLTHKIVNGKLRPSE